MADDAAPWTDEHELAKPHERRAPGYDCRWTGSLPQIGSGAWKGLFGDCYGGRLEVIGKAQSAGVISLRAASVCGRATG